MTNPFEQFDRQFWWVQGKPTSQVQQLRDVRKNQLCPASCALCSAGNSLPENTPCLDQSNSLFL